MEIRKVTIKQSLELELGDMRGISCKVDETLARLRRLEAAGEYIDTGLIGVLHSLGEQLFDEIYVIVTEIERC